MDRKFQFSLTDAAQHELDIVADLLRCFGALLAANERLVAQSTYHVPNGAAKI